MRKIAINLETEKRNASRCLPVILFKFNSSYLNSLITYFMIVRIVDRQAFLT